MRVLPMRVAACLVLLLAACAGPERDIYFASLMDDIKDLAYGGDRGLWSYRATIAEHVTSLSGPYQYKVAAPLAQYNVIRAVYGLGGTKTGNAEELAQVADTIFHVLRNDPTPVARATACSQLGRVVLRLPIDRADAIPPSASAEEKINALAQDLYDLKLKLDKGQKVKVADVVALMEQLGAVRAPRLHSAMQVVRILSLPPVALTARGKVRDLREQMAPDMVRDCILVVLREKACGDGRTRALPDDSSLVRADAADVLARVASPVALEAAAARLADSIDPAEGDKLVRAKLLRYLGEVGGPLAFQTCLVRLQDIDQGVRYHAQRALRHMTGARVKATRGAWEAWRAKRPKWQIKTPEPASEG